MECQLTKHAKTRCRQRGINPAVLETVLTYGDVEIASHSGRFRLMLSRAASEAMLEDGRSISDIDAASRVELILDSSHQIITVLKRPAPARRRLAVANATAHKRGRGELAR